MQRGVVCVSVSLALLAAMSSARAEVIPFSVSFSDRGFERIAHRRGISVFKHRRSEIIKLGAEGPRHAAGSFGRFQVRN